MNDFRNYNELALYSWDAVIECTNEYPSNMRLTYIPGKIRVKVFLAWYDFWVGFYYDREFKELYICPIPCVVFKFYRVTKVREEYDG